MVEESGGDRLPAPVYREERIVAFWLLLIFTTVVLVSFGA